MKELKEIDWTKKRKGAAIQVCPKCGRKGKKQTYKKGVSFEHKGHWIVLPGLGKGQSVTDHCFIPAIQGGHQ